MPRRTASSPNRGARKVPRKVTHLSSRLSSTPADGPIRRILGIAYRPALPKDGSRACVVPRYRARCAARQRPRHGPSYSPASSGPAAPLPMAGRTHEELALLHRRRSSGNSAQSDGSAAHPRGQSLVEFALVLPMLLVLLLGIADFGRVFQAGITMKAATRNGAEAAAQEYLQADRNSLPGTPIDYDALHLTAARVACQEAQRLPNTTFSPDSTGGTCSSIPVIRVCVHDDPVRPGDPHCGDPVPGFASSIPAECQHMQGDDVPAGADPPWVPAMDAGEDSIYVEVRTCYKFTTIFPMPLSLPMSTGLSIGEIYLSDRAVFTVANY